MKICIYTLGCKVNQYESDAIREELINLGHIVETKLVPADIYILNTCAVTNEAEHKSRATLSKFLKKNGNAKIIVCGCASQHNQEQFLKNKNVSMVIGNGGKNKIAGVLKEVGNLTEKLPLEYENFSAMTSSKTRAYLKIQDGCNYFCSYCLIPFIRGRSRSRSLEQVVSEAESLSVKNKEIVLTGINMSDYRVDGQLALGKLMKSLSHIDARIRISSLEINVITPEFLEILKAMPNFCPHFHLSMQSGCDRILKLMNRHYTKEEYLEKVEMIRQYFPLSSITTDVIVGFPTESQEDFEETVSTIKRAEFFKMHIFPYSQRKGTRAEKLEQVNGTVKNQRVKELEKLEREFQQKYLESMVGAHQTVLKEKMSNGYAVGYTENYIKTYVKSEPSKEVLIKVKLTALFKDGMKAERIE